MPPVVIAAAITTAGMVGSSLISSSASKSAAQAAVEAAKPSNIQTQLMEEQLASLRQSRTENELIKPYILQSMGLVATDTGYRRMTEEEQLASMDPLAKKAYEALGLQQERLVSALKGELPVSPALESDIEKQRTGLMENLSRRLGSGWQTTTAGIQSMGEFDKRTELLREEARRGEINTGTGLMLSQAGYLGANNQAQQAGYGAYGQRLFPLMGAYGQVQQPYQYYTGLQSQINMANAQTVQQQQAGLMGGFGSLLGAGASAYGTYAGLKALGK